MVEKDPPSSNWLTLPNAITATRIVCSPGLVALAVAQQTSWLVALAVLLVFTEWVDGFLARRLGVTSDVGARLDTIADAVFYSSLLAAVVMFRPATVQAESIWIVFAVLSYLLSWLASWFRFGCLPSYHTWAAKGVWVIVIAGIVCLLGDITPWPFRIAMICVVLTNLEATGISCVLPKATVDVPSIWHARRSR